MTADGSGVRVAETRERRRRIVLAAAMVASPFLALLYGWEAALLTLGAGLLATAFLAFDASRHASLDLTAKRRLLVAGAVNIGLAIVAGLLLLERLR
ncbi:MAG: hypothetical protein H0U10_00835 [Chloroflexia bacterium]|nr:hypothetical protein [Chloroflexia bacterium]